MSLGEISRIVFGKEIVLKTCILLSTSSVRKASDDYGAGEGPVNNKGKGQRNY